MRLSWDSVAGPWFCQMQVVHCGHGDAGLGHRGIIIPDHRGMPGQEVNDDRSGMRFLLWTPAFFTKYKDY